MGMQSTSQSFIFIFLFILLNEFSFKDFCDINFKIKVFLYISALSISFRYLSLCCYLSFCYLYLRYLYLRYLSFCYLSFCYLSLCYFSFCYLCKPSILNNVIKLFSENVLVFLSVLIKLY